MEHRALNAKRLNAHFHPWSPSAGYLLRCRWRGAIYILTSEYGSGAQFDEGVGALRHSLHSAAPILRDLCPVLLIGVTENRNAGMVQDDGHFRYHARQVCDFIELWVVKLAV